jgi:hypothetical protein
MSGFVKIYESILDSSIWSESAGTRLVWITMLAMADKNGVVEASVGGLARRAQVSREECEKALEVLSAPDPDDKSGVDEGRRIQPVPGRGWHITNHAAYREIRTDTQVKTAERVRRHRERERAKEAPAKTVTVTHVTPANVPSRAERPEADPDPDPDPERDQENPPPKDLTGHGDVLPTAVVVPHSAEERIPCPLDLALTETQRLQFQQGTGASDYQVAQLELRFRMASGSAAQRTRAAWQASIGKAVAAEFSNGRRRPPRSPDAESGTHVAARLRQGPRQPNSVDHTTLSDEEHLRRIGGTSA